MIKVSILILFISLVLLPIFLFGQEVKDTTQQKIYKNTVFIELLGATGYFSVNYERDIQLYKKFYIKIGGGYGYILKTNYAPDMVLYTFRIDLQYGNKRINPVFGYAFTHNLNLDNSNDSYFVHSPNFGIDIKINKYFHLLPKYYMMFFNEPQYNSKYIIHWYGLQVKYNF